MIAVNYIVAVVFAILWVIGFFARIAGPAIHILLAAAFALILINILHNNNNSNTKNKQLTN